MAKAKDIKAWITFCVIIRIFLRLSKFCNTMNNHSRSVLDLCAVAGFSLVRSIRCSVSFLSDLRPLLRFGEFCSIILLRVFSRPSNWEFSSSILIILRFGLFHSIPNFLDALCQEHFSFSIVFDQRIDLFCHNVYARDASISCILSMMLVSVALFFP